jgi:hypothetical protein
MVCFQTGEKKESACNHPLPRICVSPLVLIRAAQSGYRKINAAYGLPPPVSVLSSCGWHGGLMQVIRGMRCHAKGLFHLHLFYFINKLHRKHNE